MNKFVVIRALSVSIYEVPPFSNGSSNSNILVFLSFDIGVFGAEILELYTPTPSSLNDCIVSPITVRNMILYICSKVNKRRLTKRRNLK